MIFGRDDQETNIKSRGLLVSVKITLVSKVNEFQNSISYTYIFKNVINIGEKLRTPNMKNIISN